MAKPFIKYPGGKRDHAVIAELRQALAFRYYETYVLPFLGGGGDYFALQVDLANHGPQDSLQVIVGDADAELISLYAAIIKNPHAVHRKAMKEVDAIVSTRESGRKSYYNAVRNLWNAGDRPPGVQLFLRHACFNGLFRRNQSGQMNTPPRDNLGELTIPNVAELLECAQALEGVELVDWDFRQYEDELFIDESTLVYLDPPFDAGFVDYTANGFDKDDQLDLIRLAAEWDARGATVFYSNALTPFILGALVEHWPRARVDLIEASRMISSDGNRDNASEVLVRSPQ